LGAALLWTNKDSQWGKSDFELSVKRRQLLQTMMHSLLASAEAEKSAVMADTDEASKSFAEQSILASYNVEKARSELEPLLEGKGQEVHLFQDFSRCWGKLQQIDTEVLSLAVQNTNLKAFRLSFGPAADFIRSMEQSLNQLMDVVSSYPDAISLIRLASQAIEGALNIYTLHAPHIAEGIPTRMEAMESDIQRFEARVIQALQSLQKRVEESGKPLLDKAWTDYQRFQQITAEIVALSQNNSNNRSYVLSLGQKRKMTAECQETLIALRESIEQGMTYKATK
jgi:hypothetical protein